MTKLEKKIRYSISTPNLTGIDALSSFYKSQLTLPPKAAEKIFCSLRLKTLSTLFILFFILFLIMFSLVVIVFAPTYSTLEKRTSQDSAIRVMRSLFDDLNGLAISALMPFAAWDDTLSLMISGTQSDFEDCLFWIFLCQTCSNLKIVALYNFPDEMMQAVGIEYVIAWFVFE